MERFLCFVDKTETCWFWTGVTAGSNARYGYFYPGGRVNKVPAHRWLYEQVNGPIAAGLELDHLCQQKLCVRPAHLEPVTHTENRRRGRLETCRSGRHDLTVEENMRWDEKGQRRGCAACHRENANRRYTERASHVAV